MAIVRDLSDNRPNNAPITDANTSGYVLTGSLSATGDTSATPFRAGAGKAINLELSGTWVGTVVLKRKLPGDTAYASLTINSVAWGSYTTNDNEQAWAETEAGALFILDFTRTSGIVTWRLSN